MFDIIGAILKDLRKMNDIEVQTPHFKSRELTYYSNPTVGKEVGMKTFKTTLPSSEVSWNDVESDTTLTKVVFSGLGQIYITKYMLETHSPQGYQVPEGAYYVVDLSAMHKYPVRPKYEKYGATAYFNKKRQPIAI